MKRSAAVSLALFLLAGCGGGGSGSVPAASKTAAQSKVTGSVVISIPVASTTTQSVPRSVRYPQFVSPGASSVELSINGSSNTNFDVSTSSSLCLTNPNTGLRNCTLSFAAPAGNDTFVFLIFQGPNGTGSQLASATSSQTIVAGTAFNFTVALNAAIGTLLIQINASHGTSNCVGEPTFEAQNIINEGCAGSGGVTVSVEDPSGAPITGSAPYAVPINFTTNDPSITASPAQITAPGQTETVSYNGAPFAAGITNQAIITATAGGQVSQTTFPIRRSYLYVANSNDPIGSGSLPTGGGNVSVYPYGYSGAGAPLRTYIGGASLLQTPFKPLVDAAGNLYVIDNGTPAGPSSFDPTILVYGPQTATGSISPPPLRQITHLGAIGATNGCTDMEFDPTGQFLFVACATQINVFPISANGTASSVFSTEFQDDDLATETGLAFDQSGNLYISDDSLNVIDIVGAPVATTGPYHPVAGSHQIAASSGAWPASLSVISMVVDESGALYTPFFYLSSGAGAPDAVAELAIWPGTSLPCTNCAPGATLTGTPFTTHAVVAITLDPAGEAYVVNNTTNAVSVFSHASVSGSSASNVTPARTIVNAAQGAVGPIGMTVGP
jgi:hypothetical protein